MELGYKFAHNIPKSKTISPKPAIFSGARCPCPRTRNNLEAIEPELLRCRLHAQPELSEPVHLHLSSSPQLELGTTNPSSFPSSPFLLLAEPTFARDHDTGYRFTSFTKRFQNKRIRYGCNNQLYLTISIRRENCRIVPKAKGEGGESITGRNSKSQIWNGEDILLHSKQTIYLTVSIRKENCRIYLKAKGDGSESITGKTTVPNIEIASRMDLNW
ncbi:hypothetical protein LXL04_007033 [Taraxacum kok-saghyz]